MTFLPIAARELVVAARRPGTYRLRAYGCLIALIVLLLVSKSNAPKGYLGTEVLTALGVATLGFCMLAGLLLTANSIASEKEGGTIGLLFLTDLKGYDIVLGKLAANLVTAFFGLLAVFPVLGIPLLMGGVTGAEFWRLLLVFATTLFFSLALGLLVSAMTNDGKLALGWAIILMAVVAGLLPALWWLQRITLNVWWMDFLLWPSPAFAFRHGFDAWYSSRFGAADFWRSLRTIWLLTVLCLAWASFVTPRAWQTHELKTRRRRKILRRPLGWARAEAGNPYCRVTVRDWGPSRMANFLLCVGVSIWICFLICIPTKSKIGPPPAFLVCIFLGFALHVIVKLLMMVESVSRLNHDRQSGALELLLVTPLTVQLIMEAQRKALRAHFRNSIWALSMFNSVFLSWIFVCGPGVGMRVEDQWIFAELFMGGVVVLLTDFEALQWVGMWRGLTKRQTYKATLLTAAQLLGPCWMFAFFLIFTKPNIGSSLGVAGTFAIFFIAGVVVDALSLARARSRLLKDFRSVAAQRYDKTD